MSEENKLSAIWVGVAIDSDGNERIHQYIGADGISGLMVGEQQSRMNVLKSIAEKDAKRMNLNIEIRNYVTGETVEVIKGQE